MQKREEVVIGHDKRFQWLERCKLLECFERLELLESLKWLKTSEDRTCPRSESNLLPLMIPNDLVFEPTEMLAIEPIHIVLIIQIGQWRNRSRARQQ